MGHWTKPPSPHGFWCKVCTQVTCELFLVPHGHSHSRGGCVTRGGTDGSPLHSRLCVPGCASGSTQLQGGALLAWGSRAGPCVLQCPMGTRGLRDRGTRGWRDMGTGSVSHRHQAPDAESSIGSCPGCSYSLTTRCNLGAGLSAPQPGSDKTERCPGWGLGAVTPSCISIVAGDGLSGSILHVYRCPAGR